MIDTDIILIALIVLQVVLLFVHSLAQRREIHRLQGRLSTLGTEVGLLKARARKPEKAAAEPDAPIGAQAGIATQFPASSAVDVHLLNFRANPAQGQFVSPSWI